MDQNKIEAFKTAATSQGFNPQEVDAFVEQAKNMPQKPPEVPQFLTDMPDTIRQSVPDFPTQKMDFSAPQTAPSGQTSILPTSFPLTQPFGNRSRVERFSGGINLGADFAAPAGTPLATPPGEWEVVAAQPGFNQGSGNLVKIRNTQTGEIIGFEHLTKIGVQPGQKISQGSLIGLSGGNQGGPGQGNSTGAHISIPYQDARGQYQDVLKSPYAQYLF